MRSELFQKIEVIPGNYFPTLFAPDILGNPVTRNDWFGHYAEWASYAGVIPLILALFAIFVPIKKSNVLWYFVVLSLISFGLAFQTPLLDLVVNLKIPVLSTSAVSRIIVLLSFSIAVLGGFGLDMIGRSRRFVWLYSLFWLTILASMWGMILGGNLFWIAEVDAEKLSVAQRNFIFPSLLVVGGIVLMILRNLNLKKLRLAIPIIFVGMTAIDMLRFSTKWMPFEEREYMYPELPVLTYLSKERGFERVFGNFGNEAQGTFSLFGIEGYDPLYIRRYGELISSSGDGKVGKLERTTVGLGRQGKYSKKILDMLSVKLILHARGDERNVWAFPYWNNSDISQTPIYSDEQYEVYRNEGALPRAYFVQSFLVAANEQHVLDLLFSDKTDLRQTVVLEEAPQIQAMSSGELYERVRIERFTANALTINVRVNQPGLLVLTDPYYPGWSASVNGRKTKIYRANFALRAIVVPEGTSEVRFVYDHWFL